jgi:Helix-turn-helix
LLIVLVSARDYSFARSATLSANIQPALLKIVVDSVRESRLQCCRMGNKVAEPVRYNVQRFAEDMAAKGFTKLELANQANVSDMTIIRFLRGERLQAPTVKKIAEALGFSVERYLIRRK